MTRTALPPLSVEQVTIDSLRPDPANPRRICDEDLDALTRSLRQWGIVQPVLAPREDATVIAGHQRLLAARRLGLTAVPVIWLDLSAEQSRLLGLALNRIAGSWDEALLARLLAELVADLVEPAKSTALEKLGESERALGIATDWLRTKLESAESSADTPVR